MEGILGKEDALSLVEHADQRAGDDPLLAVDERLIPLVRLRVVKEEAQAFPMAVRTVGFDFLQFRTATPYVANADRAIQFDGRRRSRERIKDAPDLSVPGTNVEIEIVGSLLRS